MRQIITEHAAEAQRDAAAEKAFEEWNKQFKLRAGQGTHVQPLNRVEFGRRAFMEGMRWANGKGILNAKESDIVGFIRVAALRNGKEFAAVALLTEGEPTDAELMVTCAHAIESLSEKADAARATEKSEKDEKEGQK
jgi:hypothetical protein